MFDLRTITTGPNQDRWGRSTTKQNLANLSDAKEVMVILHFRKNP